MTSPPAASAASATAPIIPTLAAAVDEPQAALGEPAPDRARRPRGRPDRRRRSSRRTRRRWTGRARLHPARRARPELGGLDTTRRRRPGSTSPRLRRRGVLAAVARGDHHRGEHRSEDGEPGADEERVVEALGEGHRRVAHAGGERVARAAVRHRGEDRQAERAAHLLGGVDQAGGESGLVGPRAGHRGDRHGHEREAETPPDDERREQHVGDVAAGRRDLREPHEAARDQQHAGDQRGLEAHARHELRGDAGADDDAQRERQVGDARSSARRSRAPAACRATGRRTSRTATCRSAGRRRPRPEGCEGGRSAAA